MKQAGRFYIFVFLVVLTVCAFATRWYELDRDAVITVSDTGEKIWLREPGGAQQFSECLVAGARPTYWIYTSYEYHQSQGKRVSPEEPVFVFTPKTLQYKRTVRGGWCGTDPSRVVDGRVDRIHQRMETVLPSKFFRVQGRALSWSPDPKENSGAAPSRIHYDIAVGEPGFAQLEADFLSKIESDLEPGDTVTFHFPPMH